MKKNRMLKDMGVLLRVAIPIIRSEAEDTVATQTPKPAKVFRFY